MSNISDDELRAKLFPGREKESLVINHAHVFCGLHSQPFKAEWPKGSVVFGLSALKWALENHQVMADACRIHGLDPNAKIDPSQIEAALSAKPACCRMPMTKLVEVYEQSKIGVLKRCKVCGRKRLGTPIKATNIGYSHLCFSCIAGSSASPWKQ